MELTSLEYDSKISRLHIEKLVVALLTELINCGPLWLDLVAGLSETATLVRATRPTLVVSGVLRALHLLAPFGAFLRHLRALHLNLVSGLIFLEFGAQL